MEIDLPESCLHNVFDNNPDQWYSSLWYIKNSVIGRTKQKSDLLRVGLAPRLLQLMADDSTPAEVCNECAVILGSIAKGSVDDVTVLLQSGTLSVLLNGIVHPYFKYVESCLRCIRTLYLSSLAPADSIYQDPEIIPCLLNLLYRSRDTQECIMNIFACCCLTIIHQTVLYNNGILPTAVPLLLCNHSKIQLATLKFFAQFTYRNEVFSKHVATYSYQNESLPLIIARLQRKDKSSQLQLEAAKCITNLYKADGLEPDDPLITHRTLPTLVRLCGLDHGWQERVGGACTLAYLVESNQDLQTLASITDDLSGKLLEYFNYTGDKIQPGVMSLQLNVKDVTTIGNELREAAFKMFAVLSADDEDIRRKVAGLDLLMSSLRTSIGDKSCNVQVAALRLLLSISRSVRVLRTVLQEESMWQPILKLLDVDDENLLVMSSACVCNLVLTFAPSKERLLEEGILPKIMKLLTNDSPHIRLNAVWALMNMTFEEASSDMQMNSGDADPNTPMKSPAKVEILNELDPKVVWDLLCDTDTNVQMKALGLIRNLLNPIPEMEIDAVMNKLGNDIIPSIIMILEGDFNISVKEQAMCILSNMAEGSGSKQKYILGNEDMLKKIVNYLAHSNIKLQLSALTCLSNLMSTRDDTDCKPKLKELGVPKLLQQLLNAKDPLVFDRAKALISQFL